MTTAPLRHSRYFTTSTKLNVKVLDLYMFVNVTKYNIKDPGLLDELNFFSSEMQQAYHNIRRLFLIAPQINELLVLETKNILTELEKVNQDQRIKYIGSKKAVFVSRQ